MTSKYLQLAPIVFALSAACVTPLVYADTPMKSGAMHDSGHASPSMPSGGMDMKAMMKDNNEMMASMEMTGNPDIDFALMMRSHHQGGINMAEAELRDGKNPKMRKMAKTIIAAQKKEIAQLNQFLSKNGHMDSKSGHAMDHKPPVEHTHK